MLRAEGLELAYGDVAACRDISFEVAEGEIVSFIGANGAGKSTTLRGVAGAMMPRQGRILFRGADITRMRSHERLLAGIALVPEGRQLFPNLSVDEHLSAFGRCAPDGRTHWTPQRAYALFPRLQQRRSHMGNQLSGGEQQMLAIARALMTNPRLLILDEATEGLAPIIRDEIWATIRQLRATGLASLIVDKTVSEVAAVTDRVVVLVKGRIAWAGAPGDLTRDPDLIDRKSVV